MLFVRLAVQLVGFVFHALITTKLSHNTADAFTRAWRMKIGCDDGCQQHRDAVLYRLHRQTECEEFERCNRQKLRQLFCCLTFRGKTAILCGYAE